MSFGCDQRLFLFVYCSLANGRYHRPPMKYQLIRLKVWVHSDFLNGYNFFSNNIWILQCFRSLPHLVDDQDKHVDEWGRNIIWKITLPSFLVCFDMRIQIECCKHKKTTWVRWSVELFLILMLLFDGREETNYSDFNAFIFKCIRMIKKD